MTRIAEWLQAIARDYGGIGLFLVAFLDSSFLSLPQINDLLVIWMVTQRKELVLYYALMATAGSVAGCLVLYFVARKGGEALLNRRFGQARIERGMRLFDQYGVMAIIVPALLPPPAPFKLFVLLAGVVRMSPIQFAGAIAGARALRYLTWGGLAVWYGDQAMAYISEHGIVISVVMAAAVLAGGIGYFIWRRRRRRSR
jgi:membrane protein YqaA with SNARE-associated domain